MQKISRKNSRALLKKIFLLVFIIHIAWFTGFLYFTYREASDTGIIMDRNIKIKIIATLAIFFAAVLLYIKWGKKIGWIKRFTGICWKIIFTGYIIFFVYFLLGSFFNPPITFTQLGSLLQGYGLKRDYVSYGDISPNMKLAVIASEDQLFPDHDGFDLKEIKLALKYNKKHPGKMRGGSTISQQVAKNIFLWQGRTNLRKTLEVFFTFTIEKGWTKRIILDRYLNIAETGKGIFGVQAAAKSYFNKNASDLTRAEAAQIAAVLPNPKLFTVKPMSEKVRNRYDDIMRQMKNIEDDPDIQEIIK
jgi:monofunctional biosynthetic peptidoglycan transglycosylase